MTAENKKDTAKRSRDLADELRNFQEIAACLNPSPGGIPCVPGIEICSMSIPLHEGIGGDHIIYVDFNRRYDLPGRIERARARGQYEVAEKLELNERRAGILLVDVSGHRMTDALIGAMLHQAFLIGVRYELELFGEVTTNIFENINTRFYRTTSVNKYFTMIYGEISSDGTFRFLSSGHPPPAVFSREYGHFVSIDPERLVSFPPVGMLPTRGDPEEIGPGFDRFKKRYEVNEISLLAAGDTMLLYTDGLADHDDGRYLPDAAERLLADNADRDAGELCAALRQDVLVRATPVDDISAILIRKTS